MAVWEGSHFLLESTRDVTNAAISGGSVGLVTVLPAYT
jgi:hypothetical protein